jgi:hypothetical protein
MKLFGKKEENYDTGMLDIGIALDIEGAQKKLGMPVYTDTGWKEITELIYEMSKRISKLEKKVYKRRK